MKSNTLCGHSSLHPSSSSVSLCADGSFVNQRQTCRALLLVNFVICVFLPGILESSSDCLVVASLVAGMMSPALKGRKCSIICSCPLAPAGLCWEMPLTALCIVEQLLIRPDVPQGLWMYTIENALSFISRIEKKGLC